MTNRIPRNPHLTIEEAKAELERGGEFALRLSTGVLLGVVDARIARTLFECGLVAAVRRRKSEVRHFMSLDGQDAALKSRLSRLLAGSRRIPRAAASKTWDQHGMTFSHRMSACRQYGKVVGCCEGGLPEY